MPKVAKPYREASGWSMRRRIHGRDLYVSGQPTARKASEAMDELVARLHIDGRPKGAGPAQTTLAYALQDYALERLPFLKGAVQEARIINKYLRLASLPIIQVRALDDSPASAAPRAPRTVYWHVELGPVETQRRIPDSLKEHRARQAHIKSRADHQQ
jgi:hypothetical protein